MKNLRSWKAAVEVLLVIACLGLLIPFAELLRSGQPAYCWPQTTLMRVGDWMSWGSLGLLGIGTTIWAIFFAPATSTRMRVLRALGTIVLLGIVPLTVMVDSILYK